MMTHQQKHLLYYVSLIAVIIVLLLLDLSLTNNNNHDSGDDTNDTSAQACSADADVDNEGVCSASDSASDSDRDHDSDPESEPALTFGAKLLHRFESVQGKINRKSYAYPSAQGIRMCNPNAQTYDVYWFDTGRGEGIFKGPFKPRSTRSTNSYRNHVFYFTVRNEPDNEVWRFTVVKDVHIYIIPALDESDAMYLEFAAKKAFFETYLEETGRPWLAHYPRPKPLLHMWPADYIGQIHAIQSQQYYWHCPPDHSDTLEQQSKCQSKYRWQADDDSAVAVAAVGDQPSSVHIDVEVISLEPKVYAIENTISNYEAQLIIDLATPKMRRSRAGTDGGMEDETRTSRTAWLDRTEHRVLDTIFRRAADILNVSESLLQTHLNVESLQVVHYHPGQEYKAHHDFGDHGFPQSRYITLLFYLNDMVGQNDESQAYGYNSGGQTAFPKARNGSGFSTHPGKGNSVMFYSLLEDGNGDDKSLHEAIRLEKGEKYICNFWVWDPRR